MFKPSMNLLHRHIFANVFAHALITPVQTITEQLVAARSSGLSTVPFGITNVNGANVALEIGRS